MSPQTPPREQEGALERRAAEFRALSNVTRLQLMMSLGDEPVRGKALIAGEKIHPVPFPTFCHHVRVLTSAGLAESDGEFATFDQLRLTATARGRELTRSLVGV